MNTTIKLQILFFIFLFGSIELKSQTEFEITYEDTRDVYFFDAEENNSGDFLVVGNFIQSNNNLWNGLIGKFNQNGDLYFVDEIDLGYSTVMRDLVLEEDHFFIVGNVTFTNTDSPDAILLKYDYNGNLIFYQTYGGEGLDYFTSIEKTNDGNLILFGDSYSNSDNRDAYIIMVDDQGNLLWDYFIDEEDRNVYSTNELVVKNNEIFFPTYTDGNNSIIFSKLDIQGNLIWEKELIHENGYLSTSIIIDDHDDIIITGWHRTLPAYDSFILKLDLEGNQKWQKTYNYPSEGNDRFSRIIQGNDGNYYVAGHLSSGQNGKAYLSQIDTTGDVLWHSEFGGEQSDVFQHLSKTGDGKLLLCGYSKSFNSLPGFDGYLVKANYDGTVPVSFISETQEFNIFPNPSQGTINIKLPEKLINKTSIIEVFDSTGRLVFYKELTLENETKRIENLTPGFYYITISTNSSRYSKCFQII